MGGATSVALNEDEARVVYRELRREYAEQYASRALTPGEQKRMLSALAAKPALAHAPLGVLAASVCRRPLAH